MVEVILYNGNKPKKNGFRYSGFMLPIDWSGYYLDDLFDIRGGKPISRNNMANEGIACVHYGDIHTSNDLSLDVSSKYDQMPKVTKSQYIEKDLLFDGDIIFADASEDYAGIAKSIVVDNKESKHIISGLHTIVATPKNTLVYKSYSKYMFSSWFVRKQIMFFAQGISVFGISKNDLSSVIVLLPPLPEQKKIAEILSTWDEAIELKKQQLKRYENYFNQCLNKMFETRDIKQALVLGSLIVEENKTKNQSSSRGFSGAYPFFTNSREEVAKKTDYFDFDGKYIIANTGGRAYFDYFEGKFGAMSDCYVFTTKDINVKYLYYWLKSQEKYIDFVGFVGSGLNHLDKKWFKKLPVPVPTRSRQERIVEALDSINSAREKINKQIDLLMLQKQGLMQRLLTGKVRVKLD